VKSELTKFLGAAGLGLFGWAECPFCCPTQSVLFTIYCHTKQVFMLVSNMILFCLSTC